MFSSSQTMQFNIWDKHGRARLRTGSGCDPCPRYLQSVGYTQCHNPPRFNLQYELLLIPLTVAGRTLAAICPILRSLAVLPVMYVFGPWRSASNCVLPEIPKTYIEWEAPWSNIDQLLNAEVRCALNHFFTIEHNKTVYNVFWTVHWHVLGYLKMRSILCSQDLAYWRRT